MVVDCGIQPSEIPNLTEVDLFALLYAKYDEAKNKTNEEGNKGMTRAQLLKYVKACREGT